MAELTLNQFVYNLFFCLGIYWIVRWLYELYLILRGV